MILPVWFDHLDESLSDKQVQNALPVCENQLPSCCLKEGMYMRGEGRGCLSECASRVGFVFEYDASECVTVFNDNNIL